jgi:FKBP-type peptidyl-prolyl cis-trans isomerase (trigger factor)
MHTHGFIYVSVNITFTLPARYHTRDFGDSHANTTVTSNSVKKKNITTQLKQMICDVIATALGI